ncbi:MAG: winged helix-turn-helix domain-containing protein, partial [Anaerolineales bacterium]|nr:winged helix-turn-helix domain-containing protein [Anaerolineales bacterium]
GRTLLTGLAPLEREALRFFVQYPRVQHTYTSIFEAAWPEDVQHAAASNESIQQVIRGIRKKIEPNPGKPVYVVTWRGQPEGGYQFFPEGRPKG